MKKFSPPQMKEVSFPTPHTLHPTPYTLFQVRDKEESRSFVLNFPRRIIE
ncbi:DNA gyrase subunit A [Microcystis aeruginosa NIES-98]|nr:DNA gyrase subunit A [Microcystis aeruginosa NIES-98]